MCTQLQLSTFVSLFIHYLNMNEVFSETFHTFKQNCDSWNIWKFNGDRLNLAAWIKNISLTDDLLVIYLKRQFFRTLASWSVLSKNRYTSNKWVSIIFIEKIITKMSIERVLSLNFWECIIRICFFHAALYNQKPQYRSIICC